MSLLPEYKNPRFANAENTQINVEINHSVYGWIPFTADQFDPHTKWNAKEFWDELLASGKVQPYAPPVISSEQLAIEMRFERDLLLQSCDWTQLPDVPQSVKNVWAVYRQALRDITLQEGFPTNITWPTKPT